MSIKKLSENYGTYDLLTAYIMRTVDVDEEKATGIVYQLDLDLERRIEESIENEDEEY